MSDDAEPRYHIDLSQATGPKCFGCGEPVEFGMAHRHVDCFMPSEDETRTVHQFIEDNLPPPVRMHTGPIAGPGRVEDELSPWILRILIALGRLQHHPDDEIRVRAVLQDFLRAHPPAGPLL